MGDYDMEKPLHALLNQETLIGVLSKVLSKKISLVDAQTKRLAGGTVGEVFLVEGVAWTTEGDKLPYELVLKIQEKWERPGDLMSWRREYDLYASDFAMVFSDLFCWPLCHHASMDGDTYQLWMERARGNSGEDLTTDMLEKAALELGRFQGRVHHYSETLRQLGCLGDLGYMERDHEEWEVQRYNYDFLCSEQCRIPEHVKKMIRKHPWNNGKTIEYNYLRSDECDIPIHLKQMIIDIDDNRKTIFEKMKRLPVVLCHRDFWFENIFYDEGRIVLIDWDCAGWGFLGEDIASLIADDTKTECLHEYYQRFIPAYLKGLSEYMEIPVMEKMRIWEMILIKFGYRMVQNHMFTESQSIKRKQVKRLQAIFEMKNIE